MDTALLPDPRRVLGWLPPTRVWRELWFTYRPGLGPVPDEPILPDLEAAIAAGWAEDGGWVFGFDDDSQADGARSMRAYCTTPTGLARKAEAGVSWSCACGTGEGAALRANAQRSSRSGPLPPGG